jgi:membrane-anchored protein YejM (alkaline phosphatase superfamily)
MSGGKMARWTDEELSLTFLNKANPLFTTIRMFLSSYTFLAQNRMFPECLPLFSRAKAGWDLRGDAILQLDWTVGEIIKELQYLGLEKNTIIIFSSDNGPVLDDGYVDGAVEKLNGHTPAGLLRGGKYSIFEAGTRVPFIVSWPANIQPGKSDALVSQIDLLASFAGLLKQKIPDNEARDSKNVWDALSGKTKQGRSVLN